MLRTQVKMISGKWTLALARWGHWWDKIHFIREVKKNTQLGWFAEKTGGEEVDSEYRQCSILLSKRAEKWAVAGTGCGVKGKFLCVWLCFCLFWWVILKHASV